MGRDISLSRRALLASAAGAALSPLAGPVLAAAKKAKDLDPESAALNAVLAGPEVTPLHLQSIAEVRRSFEEAAQMMPGPTDGIAKVEDMTTPDMDRPVSTRLYRPDPALFAPGTLPPILVYMHGGFFVAGSVKSHDHMARWLCRATRALVVSVDYRLAPEHPYPAPVQDGLDVMRWMEQRGTLIGGDSKRIGLCGDNAGATIATSMALSMRGASYPGFKFLGLLTPILMLSQDIDFPSRHQFGEGGYRPSMKDLDWMIRHYAGEANEDPATLSPMAASSLKGLPTTLVVTAGYDAFRDEGGYFVRRLREDHVLASERLFGDTIHDFLFYPDIVVTARSAYDIIGAQFNAAVGG